MGKRKSNDPKSDVLRKQGALNARPEKVIDPLFGQDVFFDARDLVQVKYEMLRRVEIDGYAVSRTSLSFGFSRPSFYLAQSAFQKEGLPGLLPGKRGPHCGHKLTEEVLAFIKESRSQDGTLTAGQLVKLVRERFGVTVHPRSINRVLARLKKKRG
ncbi:MAG: helix-turn-helix domain-containing protein [Anaerolineae bacterium]|nr:helix-turn-helix domain-containing protein [Anaerolineae bacterium]